MVVRGRKSPIAALLLCAALAIGACSGREETTEPAKPTAAESTPAPSPSESAAAPTPPVSQRPPAQLIEECNYYASQARVDPGRVLRDTVVGGAVGAGVGAAGGAIAKGGEGAGKGAGIGAVVGATAGALYGLHEENRKSEAAQAAYADCLRRAGY